MSLNKQIYWEKSEEDILSNNFSNSSREKLENLLPKRTWKSIRRKAERMNMKRMDYFKSLRPKNHHFFKKWSEEMAYILGFIAADGCIAKNRSSYKLYFSIHEKDKDLLEKIRKILAPKNKVSYYKKERMYHFSFASTEMYNDLMKLGVTIRKTFTIMPPKIPKEYLRHYLRGLFDGDGCIHIFKRKDCVRTLPSVSLVGNINMVNYVRKVFNNLTNSKLKAYKITAKYGNIMGKLNYTCKNAVKILDFLYKNSNIYLDRKYKKCLHIKEVMPYGDY
ncbi:hypothetical protein HYW19_02050 [Candidatus Woesearchaeota archaeon]|nr:hypothetical protein [Candidatus Woesearchaeota archaeon]